MKRFIVPIAAAILLAGCFTVSETPFPKVAFRLDSAAASNITVSVHGFDTTLTDYVMVDGYQTIFYDGGPYWYGGGVATAHSTTIVPQKRPSDMFLDQARDRLERLGFNVMAQTPDYVVEARFSGPTTTAGDTAKSIAWFVCSLLTCDHGAQTWTARLKIRDNHTGRLVFSKDYSQKYEVTGFSPIPLIGISSYERTTSNYMQCWCLGAMTEQIAADTAEFLTRGK